MKVTLYAKDDCPPCNDIREYLKKRQIPFEEVKVPIDWRLRDEVMEVSGQGGIPVVVIGEDVIIGFQPWKMDECFSK